MVGAGVVLLLTGLVEAGAACPAVDYPPGVDVGAGTVRGDLEVDDAGRVVGARWEGPEPLVAAVAASVGGCTLAPGPHGLVWAFDAPPVNVAGTLRSRGDGAPVSTVVSVGDRTVHTDAAGRFALRNVAPGVWAVRVIDPAWRVAGPATIRVSPDVRVELTLEVVPDRVAANEIVAEYARDGTAGVLRTVDLDRARAIPGTLGDPLRATQQEAGLGRAPFEAGWLLVRGADYDETGAYLDGVRVPLVYHLGGFASVLHPEMVEAVRFWPGVFPARYGNATSGAVDLVPRPVGDGPARAVGGVNLVFAHAYAEVPTSFGGVALAARRSYLDAVLTPVFGAAGADIAPRFADVSGQVRVGRTRVIALVTQDRIDVPAIANDVGGTVEIVQRGAQVQAVIPVGAAVEVRPWLVWSRRALQGAVLDPEVVDDVTPGLRIEGEAERAGARATGGLEVQRRWFRLERSDLARSAPVWQLAPYGGLSTGDAVRAWTEARLDVVAVERDPTQPLRTAVSPRAGVDVALGGGLSLRGAFGRLIQPPPPSLWLIVADGAYLPLERSDQVSAGLRWRWAGLWAEAEAWVRRSSALGELEFDGSIDLGEGRAYGVESRLRGVHGGFDGSALVQWSRTFGREDPEDPWAARALDAPVRIELVAIQALPRVWVASARWRFTSGFARVPEGEGLVPRRAYDILLQRTQRLGLGPDDPRLAPFHALDLRVGRRFTLRRWQLDVGLEVQNVYSRRVVEPIVTGFGDARPPYGFGLPILPIFSVDGRFFPGPRE